MELIKKGLGSSSQLSNLLKQIQLDYKYDKFKNRFVEMFNYIFKDDLLILIKNKSSVDIYFILGEDICKYFEKASNNIDDLTSIINRWEGNSIRIDRRRLLEKCTHSKITLDLSMLDCTVIKYINDFDQFLHESYVTYFNQNSNKVYQKDRTLIIQKLNEMFDKFDINFGELCS